MLTENEALERILARVQPLGAEMLPLRLATGRYAAVDLAATIPSPPFDNSSMDGFALAFAGAGAPAGTRFRIVETGEDYVVEDYGSALVGRYTIDLYKSTRAEMNRWGVRYVTIEILQLGSYPVSLAVLIPRQKYPHVRQMVAGLQKKVRG